jgi:hypothetical protein
LAWTDQLFAYCERGQDPSFWAEPFNAVSNAAFVIAAVAAGALYARRGHRDPVVFGLIILVGVMGVGSFLFHTFATRWASVADTAPIGIFMLAYLALAVSRFIGLPWWAVAAALGLFLYAMRLAGQVTCGPELLPITAAAGRGCLNGSLGYIPALIALALVAAVLAVKRHPASGLIALGAAVFAVSLTMRSLDFEVCALTEVMGRARGTHALWHGFNALLLYVLLRAAILHPRAGWRQG